jgi:hypothetical protein
VGEQTYRNLVKTKNEFVGLFSHAMHIGRKVEGSKLKVQGLSTFLGKKQLKKLEFG